MNNSSKQWHKIDQASRWLHPSLIYENGHPHHDIIDKRGDNLDKLYGNVVDAYPQAGRRYWSVRTWTLVYWQLVYLCIVCAHRLQLLIDTSGVMQHIKGSSVYGYHFDVSTEHTWHEQTTKNKTIDEATLIHSTGSRLGQDLESLFLDSRKIFTLNQRQAFRLVAATVVSGLNLYLERKQGECVKAHCQYLEPASQEELHRLVLSWLRAMNLCGEAEFTIKKQKIHIVRKACCLHHLVASHDMCRDCPKLGNNKRL